MAVTPSRTLDCQGLQCPLPVIKTSQTIKELSAGDVLELIATDPGVEPDMKAWTTRTGNELIEINENSGVFHVFIRKS